MSEKTTTHSMDDERLIYRVEEWPHGLRCAACDGLFVEGQQISERLDSFVDDCPVLVLTCVPCNLAGVPLLD